MSQPTTPVPDPAAALDAFAQALDHLLAAMPAEQARVVRLSAVPHWLDGELLGALLGAPEDVPHGLDLLRPLRIVSWEPDGRFRIHDAARQHLRRQLRATDPATWRSANAAAWSYFRDRTVATAGARPVTESVEALYHQLVVDEAAGLAELGRQFDEAVWNHQLGLAERFVRVAAEQAAELSPHGQAWLRYYEARLAQLYRSGDGGEAAFTALAAETANARLAAAAQLALARLDVDRQHWQPAVRRLNEAHTVLARDGAAAPERARIALALGDAYRDLAVRSGGSGQAVADPAGLWYTVRLLPFLAVRGMARRWRRAPNWWWWHAGADYQDWIIAWLLERAQHWYRQAEAGFGPADARGRVDAATALAETSRQLGRWATARARFEGLLAEDVVRNSPYGTARTELGLGAVLADQGALPEARQRLTAARDVFQRFGDVAGVGAANLALGHVGERAEQPEEAAAAYTAGVAALAAAGDRLALTDVDARLGALMAGGALPDAPRTAAEQARASISEHHHLARFSGRLLVWFRRLALYVATPIAFALGTLLLAVALIIMGAVIETEWRLLVAGELGKLAVSDHLTLLAVAIGLALGALWLYPFVYGLFGMVLVRLLGNSLVHIEREQPAVAVVTAEGLGLDDGQAAGGRRLAWPAATGAAAVDLRLWRRAVHLASRTAVSGAADGPLVIEAIVARYEDLQDALRRRLTGAAALARHDLVVLSPRWVAGILVACAALVAGLDAAKLVPVIGAVGTRAGAGETIDLELTITMPLVYLFVTFVLGLTTITHWRLVAHDRRLRRATGLSLGVIPFPLLVLAALAWTVVCALVLAAMVLFGQQLGLAG